ncbi:MAG: class I SAM-dependent methyltransferase [Candidatus Micrarchaeota archaeon]
MYCVPSYSSAGRFRSLSNKFIEFIKAGDSRQPVVVDYGTGTGHYSRYLEARLRRAGLKPCVIATDRLVLAEAAKRLRGTRVALVERDLSRTSLLGRHSKADAVRLGVMLHYNTLPAAKRLLRNAVSNLKTGGILCHASHGFTGEGALFRKVGRNALEVVHVQRSE